MSLNKLLTTPIQRLNKNINNNKIFIKRDDLIPFSFGGNKVRKALYFFEDITKKQADCIVTYGSSSSNHCRIIANMATIRNIPCYIITPIESSSSTANNKLVESMGVNLTKCSVKDVASTIEQKILSLRKQGYDPYFIPGGGHGNLGTQAHVDIYQEIKNYEIKNNIYFDYIFHASGTGTTQAGLICGKEINGDNRKVIGISIARQSPYGAEVVLDSANNYLDEINKPHLTMENIHFEDDYIVDGYGSFNKKIIDTVKEVFHYEGIPLDLTYTGKAYWGMKEYTHRNRLSNKKILFIHTGGTPLFFDKLGDILNG